MCRDFEFCPCCEQMVSHLHLMEWDGPLSMLCSECASGAAEDAALEDQETSGETSP